MIFREAGRYLNKFGLALEYSFDRNFLVWGANSNYAKKHAICSF